MTIRILNVKLQAAHCIAWPVASEYSVEYATTIIAGANQNNIVQAEKLIKHEKYSPSNQYINDIGLVRLETPLNITMKGYRVKLPALDSYFETGTSAQLCGWGTNSVRASKCFKCF